MAHPSAAGGAPSGLSAALLWLTDCRTAGTSGILGWARNSHGNGVGSRMEAPRASFWSTFSLNGAPAPSTQPTETHPS
jgi:hypothetical protein